VRNATKRLRDAGLRGPLPKVLTEHLAWIADALAVTVLTHHLRRLH
jgi:hypothetical protein